MRSHRLAVTRFADHAVKYPQLKDPSVVRLPDGRFAMYVTLCGSAAPLAVGRFVADTLAGPWRELSPVRFHGLAGPELCAPAVRLAQDPGRSPHWEMFIQTSCFRQDGVIARAVSRNGRDFFGQRSPALSRASLGAGEAPVVGLYDAGLSRIAVGWRLADCLVYSGYSAVGLTRAGRFAGVGELFMSLRFVGEVGWTPGRRILTHRELPFHNQPEYASYEWGLEGAKLLQLAENQYLLVGVCFLEKPDALAGQRQRVFFAAAASPYGPFAPVMAPLEPGGPGETGHPDALLVGDKLALIHQERRVTDGLWHLRRRDYPLAELRAAVSDALSAAERPLIAACVAAVHGPDHAFMGSQAPSVGEPRPAAGLHAP